MLDDTTSPNGRNASGPDGAEPEPLPTSTAAREDAVVRWARRAGVVLPPFKAIFGPVSASADGHPEIIEPRDLYEAVEAALLDVPQWRGPSHRGWRAFGAPVALVWRYSRRAGDRFLRACLTVVLSALLVDALARAGGAEPAHLGASVFNLAAGLGLLYFWIVSTFELPSQSLRRGATFLDVDRASAVLADARWAPERLRAMLDLYEHHTAVWRTPVTRGRWVVGALWAAGAVFLGKWADALHLSDWGALTRPDTTSSSVAAWIVAVLGWGLAVASAYTLVESQSEVLERACAALYAALKRADREHGTQRPG